MSDNSPQQENDSENHDSAKLVADFRRIARSRTRLIVYFWTFPVYFVAIWMLLSNGRGIELMMWVYLAVYAGFAIDMTMRRCPICHKQFYVKKFTTSCAHCGRSSRPAQFTVED
jgi:hypothetical protein